VRVTGKVGATTFEGGSNQGNQVMKEDDGPDEGRRQE